MKNLLFKQTLIAISLALSLTSYASANTSSCSANNGTYIGGCVNGKYHGQGTFISTNGNKYVGQFQNGKPVK